MDQKEQIEKVAHVLGNWEEYAPRKSTRGRKHSGLKHIEGNEKVAAERILQRNWNGRMVVSSMFKMAQYVESVLELKLNWLDRYHLARLLMSSLTFAGIYKLEKDNEEDWFEPYTIHSLVDHDRPEDQPSFKTRIGKPFPKWTSNVDEWGNVLVKSSEGCPPELEYQPEFFSTETYPVDSTARFLSVFLEAVHKLERIPFRINDELLDLIIELDKNPDTRIIHSTPPDDVLEEREQKLAELYDQFDMDSVNAKWKAHPSSKIEEIDTMDDDEKSRHQRYHKQKYLIQEWKKSYATKRERFLEEVEQAKKLKGKVFYQRVKVGHNGRIYFPEGLSYQGSDFARAVVEFADGVRVSDDGARFIHLHAINQLGEKGDIDMKMEVGGRMSLACAYVALNPVEQVALWADADKPYCYLRACLDVIGLWPKYADQKLNDPKQVFQMNAEQEGFCRSIVARGNKQNGRFVFESHLPVELDQSNSAFAHIGLLMGDEELQKKAGMDKEWSDVYSDIAESVNLGGPDKGETRKIIKSISVPWSYGAGEKTCGDALVKLRNEDPDKFPYLWTLDSIEKINDLAGEVIEVLKAEFKACEEYKERIQKAVSTAKKLGNDCVEYVSPFGFHVVHRKYGTEKRQDEVWGGEKWIRPVAYRPTKPSWSELRTSTPAILVHSLDAALIHGVLALGMMTIDSNWGSGGDTVGIAKKELADTEGNPFPIITIHDCFACHASVAPVMQKMLLNGLATMYREFDPLNLFLWAVEGSGFRPQDRDTSWKNWARNAFG